MDNIKISSNRSFGIVFFVFFFIVALYPLLHNNEIKHWSIIISLIFLILGILDSRLLSPLNKVWFKFGLLLAKIVSPIVMAIIFFFVVTPTGIIMKLLGKDLLNLRFNNKQSSYWIEKSGLRSKMKNQF